MIPQGANPANLEVNEIASIDFYYKAVSGDAFSLHISPREKADLIIEDMTVNVSQGGKWTRKKKVSFSVICLESDMAFFQQLYFFMQQPCKCHVLTAGGKHYNFIPNGTSQATQVEGAATGSNIGSLNFEFDIDPDKRQITIAWDTELSLAEYNYVITHLSASVAGTDISTTLHTAGTLANATGGQGSYRVPDWNSWQCTNSGGTALMGVIKSLKLKIKSDGETIKDNIRYGQRLIMSAEGKLGSISASDLQAFHTNTKEGVTYLFNSYAADAFKFVNVATTNTKINVGDTAMDVDIILNGAAVINPNDAATPPLPNIDHDLTVGAEIFTMKLVNF